MANSNAQSSTTVMLKALFVNFYNVAPEIRETPIVYDAIGLCKQVKNMDIDNDFDHLIRVNADLRGVLNEMGKGNKERAQGLTEQSTDIMSKADQCVAMQSQYTTAYKSMVSDVSTGLDSMFNQKGRPSELSGDNRKTEQGTLKNKLSQIKDKTKQFAEKTFKPIKSTVEQTIENVTIAVDAVAKHLPSTRKTKEPGGAAQPTPSIPTQTSAGESPFPPIIE